MPCIILFSSCTKSITGEGAMVNETRNIPAFTGIKLEGSGNVEIQQGSIQSVHVSGYANLVQIYSTFVSGGMLVLKFEENNNIRKNNVKTTIVVPDLTSVQIHGSGGIQVNGFANAGNFSASIEGSGKIVLTGSVFTKLATSINGSGDIDAKDSPAPEVKVDINGSGYIAVNCLQQLNARISGSGDVEYWGNPTVNADISGSGKVKKRA